MGGNLAGLSDTAKKENISNQEVPEGNGFIFFGQVLPTEMCEEVFLNVPAVDLVISASRVCKNWYHLLTNINFWIRKVKREGFQLPAAVEMRLTEEDTGKALRILQSLGACFLPINCNLIRNPSGKDGLKYWQVRHGGDNLKVECPPVGSNNIPEGAGLPTQHCFVSSYYKCIRSQTICLKDVKIEPWMMDILRPEIWVSEWVSARWDCDAKSLTSVELFGTTETPSLYTMQWSSRNDGVVNREWYKMSMVLDYPAGLSAIKFTNASSDEQFWAGHYGAKTAGSSVILHL